MMPQPLPPPNPNWRGHVPTTWRGLAIMVAFLLVAFVLIAFVIQKPG